MKSDPKNIALVWAILFVLAAAAGIIGAILHDHRPIEIHASCVYAGRIHSYAPGIIKSARTYEVGYTIITFHTGLKLTFSSATPCVISTKRVPMVVDPEVGG